MLNLYYATGDASGTIVSYNQSPMADTTPPAGLSVVSLPDGTAFLNTSGQPAVHVNTTATPPVVALLGQ